MRTVTRFVTTGILALAVVLFEVTSQREAASAETLADLCPSTSGWSAIPPPTDVRVHESRTIPNQVVSLAEDWRRPGRLYAGALWGTYISDDCGRTWNQVQGYRPPSSAGAWVHAVAADPNGHVFVAWNVFQKLEVSDDGGSSWRSVKNDRGSDMVAIAGRGLSASATGRLYVSTASSNSVRNAEGFHYTDDGGETWTMRRGESGPYQFVADPQDRSVVYGYRGQRDAQPRPGPTPGIPSDELRQSPPYQLYRSNDSGATFQPWSEVEEVPGTIGVSVDGSRLWFASYGQHLWQSRDVGQRWQVVDAMPFIAPLQVIGSPHDPRVFYAVSDDGEIWAYREPAVAPAQIPEPE